MKKKYTLFRPRIKSRHPSHKPFRTELPLLPFRSVVRFGSTTVMTDDVTNGGNRIECNTVAAVKNSANKKLMKHCFEQSNVPTAKWFYYQNEHFIDPKGEVIDISQLEFPIVGKYVYGSRGTGNTLLKNAEEFESYIQNKNLNNYIFEKFYNFSREYRLHVTKDGCFYTCRKMLKSDIPEENRWYRNDSNSVWILEDNELFDKPVNWKEVEEACVNALLSTNLDIGAVDLKIQSRTNKKGKERENPEFIILEINSAPSMGEITLEKYLTVIPQVLRNKYNNK